MKNGTLDHLYSLVVGIQLITQLKMVGLSHLLQDYTLLKIILISLGHKVACCSQGEQIAIAVHTFISFDQRDTLDINAEMNKES